MRVKFNPVKGVIKGKKIVVVDDSIVRGTTSRQIVRMLREAGAKEVHLRVSSPPITDPCFFGIDTPERDKLVAANYDIQTICEMIDADSLGYLSIDGMLAAVGLPKETLCMACFNGDYPIPVPQGGKGGCGC